MNKVLVIFLAIICFLLTTNSVFSEEKIKLTDKEQAAVQNFAAALLENPIEVVLKAKLSPPITEYYTEFVEEDLNTLRNRFSEVINVPENISTGQEYDYVKSKQKFSVRFIFVHGLDKRKWDPQIPCGNWTTEIKEYEKDMQPLALQVGSWYHPNEGGSKCPHKEGTDHPGTIGVNGKYSIALDYKGTPAGSETEILKGTWSYDCKYTDGSKSGSVSCKIELTSWEGQYGSMAIPGKKPLPTQKVALGLIGLGALLGGGFYIFRKLH